MTNKLPGANRRWKSYLPLLQVVAFALLALRGGLAQARNNFVVYCSDQGFAAQVAQSAERLRAKHADDWFGAKLLDWERPCPIEVTIDGSSGGGATSISFVRGQISLDMKISGTRERIMADVLPHEVLHTVLHSILKGTPPRWIDEGACSAIESDPYRADLRGRLLGFLRSNRGIPFDEMFAYTEYPRDVMALYAQGMSTAEFLLAHGGKRHLGAYMVASAGRGQWKALIPRYFGYANLSELQDSWLSWIKAGSPQPEIVALEVADEHMMPLVWKNGRWQRCQSCQPQQPASPAPSTPVAPPSPTAPIASTETPAAPPTTTVTPPPVSAPVAAVDSKPCACGDVKSCTCGAVTSCVCPSDLQQQIKNLETTIAALQAQVNSLQASTAAQGQPATPGTEATVDLTPAQVGQVTQQVLQQLPPFTTQIIDPSGKVLQSADTHLGETLKFRLYPRPPQATATK